MALIENLISKCDWLSLFESHLALLADKSGSLFYLFSVKELVGFQSLSPIIIIAISGAVEFTIVHEKCKNKIAVLEHTNFCPQPRVD